jgi:flagellin
MAVINTNFKALFSENALANTSKVQSLAMQKLATGKRINSARDDAAGIAIATGMTTQIRGLTKVVRNAGDAINLIQTAEGATNSITEMMQRMRELAVQAANDTNDDAQRSYLDLEFQQLKQQIVQVASNTEWNGFPVLDGTAGERVGEMPVYKVTSENLFSSAFSLPALRTGDLKINGIDIGDSHASDDKLSPIGNAASSAIAKAAAINRMAVPRSYTQGETQNLIFTGTPSAGSLSVGGVSVTLTNQDTTSAAAATKIAAALKASSLYAPSTGRIVSYIPGNSNISITYGPNEGNMPVTTIQAGATGLTSVAQTTAEYFTSTAGTGVSAKVNGNIMSGRAMSGVSVVRGNIFINGYATADITTVLNNLPETRANVVREINLISHKTGVEAFDTGSDEKGITLTATDGRNIDVSFETNGNKDDLGSRIGLRQGVQSSTISLESKISAPLVLSSDSTGDIARAGLIRGNFTKNEAVANTAARTVVSPNVAQVESVTYSGLAPGAGDTFSLTVNGTTFSYLANTSDGLTTQAVRNGLVALVNADATLPVTATAGRNKGEILLTADTAGTSFTLSNTKSNVSTAITSYKIKANARADFKPLGVDDLVINGVKIPASSPAGDIDSNKIASSSDPASSAKAIAVSINSQTPITGVLAKANGAEINGTTTVTSLPALSAPTDQSLFINGIEIKVQFVQNESVSARLNKVVTAVNASSGVHGVTAVNNGNGTSLKSDGRNLSVWFDSNVKGLSVANFGLDQGGAVAQVSQISISGTPEVPTVTQTSTYVEFSDFATSTESLSIANDAAPVITSGVLSYVGGTLYCGNGTIAKILGTVDNIKNGTNGATLRINFPTIDPLTQFLNPANQHYYQAISATATWGQARTLALGSSLFGLNGYLATISDSSEQAFINTKLAGREGWIGASDQQIEGSWKWMDGPEAGSLFYQGTNGNVSGVTVNGQFANWDPASAEPNNSGDEDYAYIWANGKWNDFPGSAALGAYVVEYGGAGFGTFTTPTISATELTSLRNKIIYTNTAPSSDNASIVINGVSVTSAVAPRNVTSIAANLEIAINAKINSGEIKNISVQRNAGILTIQSTVAGTPFNLSGASTNYVDNLINISEVTSNSLGQTVVRGIRNATAKSSEALTVYGTVQLVSQAPVLPDLRSPNEAVETQMHRLFSTNEKPFTVSSGADGFSSNSNFSALGFMEGEFGGRASYDMDPPKVGRLAFQVGSGASQLVTIDLADFGKDGPITAEITGDVDQNLNQRKIRINTSEGASDMLAKLDLTLDKVNAVRSNMGAVMNRLDEIINNVINVSMNMSKSRSVIEDADYATASSELAKAQIMQQAATAVLAQANINQQTVLKLLG